MVFGEFFKQGKAHGNCPGWKGGNADKTKIIRGMVCAIVWVLL